MSDVIDDMKKQTYRDVLDRLGYFCNVCGQEQQNANGLVHFTSKESVNGLNVCHDCLPDSFE